MRVAALAAVVCLLTGEAYAEAESKQPPKPTAKLLAVDAARGHAVAVGEDGVVLSYDRRRGTWRREPRTTKTPLEGVAVLSKARVWAVGTGGYFTHLQGGAWISPPGSTSKSYHGVAFASRGRGIAVGDKGKVRHWVRNAWYDFSAMAAKPTLHDVTRVGRGRGERFVAVGAKGQAVAFSGVGRSLAADFEKTGLDVDLVAIAACTGRRVESMAVGAQAVIRGADGTWRRLPDPPAALRGVAVRCERGAVVEAFAATDGGLAVYDAASDAWSKRALEDAPALNDVAWLDRKQLVVVGDDGFARVIAAED